jgi:uncharacterized protein (DUF983 family)
MARVLLRDGQRFDGPRPVELQVQGVTGILMYDLAGNWCEECGRAKSYRLFPGTLTACKTCNEVVTRHRCTGRPDPGDIHVGASWGCPDCGTLWTAVEREDLCGECGQVIGTMRKTWDSVPGDRIDTAPKYDPPPPFIPFRNLFRDITAPPAYSAWRGRAFAPASLGECYRMASGAKVHVRPGCRCKT